MTGFLCLVGLIALAGISFAVSKYSGKKRTKGLAVLAEALGFSFQAKSDVMAVISSGKLRLFTRGDSRTCTNVMWQKTGDLTVTQWDFTYIVGFNKDSMSYSQTVTMFQKSNLNLPRFILAPKGFFERNVDVFGLQNIEIREFPEFSRSYLLRGEDERATRIFFREEVLRYIEAHPGYNIEACGNTLIVYHPEQLLKVRKAERELMSRMEVFKFLERNPTR